MKLTFPALKCDSFTERDKLNLKIELNYVMSTYGFTV